MFRCLLRKRTWGMGTRRRFSAEYEREAMRLVRERGVSAAQAARELEIRQVLLRV